MSNGTPSVTPLRWWEWRGRVNDGRRVDNGRDQVVNSMEDFVDPCLFAHVGKFVVNSAKVNGGAEAKTPLSRAKVHASKVKDHLTRTSDRIDRSEENLPRLISSEIEVTSELAAMFNQ